MSFYFSLSQSEEEEEEDELREKDAITDKTQDAMQKEETEEESTTLYRTPSYCISLSSMPYPIVVHLCVHWNMPRLCRVSLCIV